MTDTWKHKGAYCEMIASAWLLKEGYEVFRNISQHGSVDVLAIKNNEIFKFDVKSSNGNKNSKLSSAQIKENVKLLKVYDDGSCIIDWEPKEVHQWSKIICKHCSNEFIKKREDSIFCRKTCKVGYHAKIKRGLARVTLD